MNERQAILHEVSKLSDEHCAPCKFNNTSNNNVCKFMCSIGKQLQDYGAELLGVNEIIPERVDAKELSQRSIDTIRTDEYKAFTKLRESLTLRAASEQLGLSEQVKNHYNYVDIERYQKGVALDDEMIDRKTTKELAHEMSDKGLTAREIAEKLGVQIHTIYNYRTQRRNRLNVGLVDAGIISNDGWAQVKEITPYFEVDKEDPRIVVELKNIEKKGD